MAYNYYIIEPRILSQVSKLPIPIIGICYSVFHLNKFRNESRKFDLTLKETKSKEKEKNDQHSNTILKKKVPKKLNQKYRQVAKKWRR